MHKSLVNENFPANPGLNFLIYVKEWHKSSNYEQMHEFRVRAADQFILVAAGHNEVAVKFTGGNFSDGFLTNKERLNAFVFNIALEEQKKLKKGIPYKLVPLNDNDEEYYWIVPEDLIFIY